MRGEARAQGESPSAQPPAEAPNIAGHLARQAQERPTQRALVKPAGRDPSGQLRYEELTFRQLNARCDRLAWALKGKGLAPGERVLILVRPGFDLIALMFALFKLGAVPVFVDPGMGLKMLARCTASITPRALVGIGAAQAAWALLGRRALGSIRQRFLLGGGFGWGAKNLDRLALQAPPDPFPTAQRPAAAEGAILFTSGSTGPAKGVVATHPIFQAQVRQLREVYGIEPGEVDLPGLPIFALFSVALGATTVLPDMDPTRPAQLDADLFIETLKDQKVTYSFGSPAIWRPVLAACQRQGTSLPSLRRILMAGAPVPPSLHQGLRALLPPGADTHTPYGATEALPLTSISGSELEETFAATAAGAGTCVGHPLPGITLKIIALRQGPISSWSDVKELPPQERGEIVVSGPVITPAYCELPQATQGAKIQDGERLWHRMGDLGYLDGEGRLWFCGRQAHRVETPRGILYPVCCEAIFNAHPKVARSALVGLGELGEQRPLLVVQPLPGTWPRGSLARQHFADELRQLGATQPHTASIEEVLFHADFPVDMRHNAKIRRGELAAWARTQRKPS